jgi:hypothetical protein
MTHKPELYAACCDCGWGMYSESESRRDREHKKHMMTCIVAKTWRGEAPAPEIGDDA